MELSAAEQAFIQENRAADVNALLLQRPPAGMDIKKLAGQILARQKAQGKLPTWYARADLLFPPALSVEQASSERAAQYKASLVQGAWLIDLTGGMGVDTWAFARRVDRVVYMEQQTELAALAAYNLPRLGCSNVDVRAGDGLLLLGQTDLPGNQKKADWLYLDPHRRNEQGGRVVKLDDCEPDLTQPGVVDRLFTHAQTILVKVSPLLDIDMALRQLGNRVSAVHVVAVLGEVKELLFVIGNQSIDKNNIQFNTVNLLPERTIGFQFRWQQEQEAGVTLGDPQRYLYEPNAAVLKAGAFRLVATRFGLTKLAPNSHLYTSQALQPDFPGRIFCLRDMVKPDRKILQQKVPELKANLTVRNFPQTVAELRKKLSLREGGSLYILATTLQNGDKRLLITQKVDLKPT